VRTHHTGKKKRKPPKGWPDPALRLPSMATPPAIENPVSKQADMPKVAIGLRREIAERSRNVGAD